MKPSTHRPFVMLVIVLAAAPAFAKEAVRSGPASVATQVLASSPAPGRGALLPAIVIPPNQLIPALPGTVVPALPRQLIPPLPGQLVPLLPGQMVPALPGQIVQALPGQLIAALPGQISP